jgi:hypothetical protein
MAVKKVDWSADLLDSYWAAKRAVGMVARWDTLLVARSDLQEVGHWVASMVGHSADAMVALTAERTAVH